MLKKPKTSSTPAEAETSLRKIAALAIAARSLLPAGNVLVVSRSFEAIADEITTQDASIFHHVAGTGWVELRAAFGRTITLASTRPKRLVGYQTVIDHLEGKA